MLGVYNNRDPAAPRRPFLSICIIIHPRSKTNLKMIKNNNGYIFQNDKVYSFLEACVFYGKFSGSFN